MSKSIWQGKPSIDCLNRYNNNPRKPTCHKSEAIEHYQNLKTKTQIEDQSPVPFRYTLSLTIDGIFFES